MKIRYLIFFAVVDLSAATTTTTKNDVAEYATYCACESTVLLQLQQKQQQQKRKAYLSHIIFAPQNFLLIKKIYITNSQNQ